MSNRMVRNIYSQAAQNAHNDQNQHEDKSKDISKDRQLPSDLHKDIGTHKDVHKDVRKDADKDVSKESHKDVQQDITFRSLAEHMVYLPTTDEIDLALVKAKRLKKTRINGNVPLEWKQKLDLIAEHLDVAKYDMVAYLIGRFLGEIDP